MLQIVIINWAILINLLDYWNELPAFNRVSRICLSLALTPSLYN